MNNKIRANVSPLKEMFYLLKDNPPPEIEMMEMDVTETVYEDIDWRIRNKQLINMHFRGQVITGKSTAAQHCTILANECIIKYNIRPDRVPMTELILADNGEYLRFTRKGYRNVVVVIDEYNPMGETGLSATTEMRALDWDSDVAAQNFIGKIGCSPVIVPDKNCEVILEVMGINKQTETTICKVVYRDTITQQLCVLGVARFKVTDVLHQDWYKRYRNKKFLRIDLMQKKGIANYKEFEWSELVMEVTALLERKARRKKITADTIKAEVETIKYEKSAHYSTLNIDDLVLKIRPILTRIYDKAKALEDLKKNKITIDINYDDNDKLIIHRNGDKLSMEKLTQKEKELVEDYLDEKRGLARILSMHHKILKIFDEYKKIM